MPSTQRLSKCGNACRCLSPLPVLVRIRLSETIDLVIEASRNIPSLRIGGASASGPCRPKYRGSTSFPRLPTAIAPARHSRVFARSPFLQQVIRHLQTGRIEANLFRFGKREMRHREEHSMGTERVNFVCACSGSGRITDASPISRAEAKSLSGSESKKRGQISFQSAVWGVSYRRVVRLPLIRRIREQGIRWATNGALSQ